MVTLPTTSRDLERSRHEHDPNACDGWAIA